MLTKFLNPKNDLAFKRVFGTEDNKDIAIHFLNDIFGVTTNPIEEITFLQTVQIPETIGKRMSLVDMMCKDAHGDKFIVEMQVTDEPGFEKRAQYYAAKAYVEQREKKVAYKDLKRITFLAITNFVLFPEKEDYLSHHIILDKDTCEHDLKDFSFSFMELPKFKKDKHQLVSMTEKWAYFFKYAEDTKEEDLPLLIGEDYILKRAYDELNRFSWSDAELWSYESYEMKRISEQTILEGARAKGERIGLKKGEQIGLKKGEQIGLEKGEQIGLEKGRYKERLETARKLKQKNFSKQDIKELTGLTDDEIGRL